MDETKAVKLPNKNEGKLPTAFKWFHATSVNGGAMAIAATQKLGWVDFFEIFYIVNIINEILEQKSKLTFSLIFFVFFSFFF